jgi:hypothetical protein
MADDILCVFLFDLLSSYQLPGTELLCIYDIPLESVKELIWKVVLSKHSSKALQLLAGYARVHQTFEGFDEFADSLEVATGSLENSPDSCLEFFSKQPEACMIGERLGALSSELISTNAYTRPEAAVARTALRDAEGKLVSANEEIEAHRSFVGETQAYADKLEFLGLKNQCFDAIDGKVTSARNLVMYSLNIFLHNTTTDLRFSSFRHSLRTLFA